MAVASPPAETSQKDKGGGGFQVNWTAVLFMLPAALLLLAFLIFPAIFTVGLSFDRGRGGRVQRVRRPAQLRQPVHERSELPAHRLPTFGRALEQRAVDGLLHVPVRLPGAPHRRHGDPRPVRSRDQGDRLPADGHRGHRDRRHLELRLLPELEHRTHERHPRHLRDRSGGIPRESRHGQLGAHRGRRVGLGRVRHGDPLGRDQGHLDRGARGRPRGRRNRDATSSSGSSSRWSAFRSRSSP